MPDFVAKPFINLKMIFSLVLNHGFSSLIRLKKAFFKLIDGLTEKSGILASFQ